MDKEQQKISDIEYYYCRVMDILGIKKDDDNAETPKRVAKALLEMTESLRKPIDDLIDVCTTFDNNSRGIELEQDDIEFSSMCSHHHLPFFGKVKITYIPSDRIMGLSKFNRVVNYFSRKPQVQEDMTSEIGHFLVAHLNPQFLEVELYDCQHSCMCARGVHSRAKTKTKFTYGSKKIPIKINNSHDDLADKLNELAKKKAHGGF